MSNLQGAQSEQTFWRRYPAVALFSFQCSPMTQANGILEQFRMACNYAKHAHHTRTVLLLDEVGLAEHSPDLPLKVLHGILVDPPIAVVGISNWALDAAKMNRAVCLQRPEPLEADLHATGEAIVRAAVPTPHAENEDEEEEAAHHASSNEKGTVAYTPTSVCPPPLPTPTNRTKVQPSAKTLTSSSRGESSLSAVLGPLAMAYHAVYTQQRELSGGRDFVGMRDYYSLLKVKYIFSFEFSSSLTP